MGSPSGPVADARLALAASRIGDAVPPGATALIDELHAAGHAAFVVGGSPRDVLLGREPHDWDLATDARPDRMLELFPGAVYENAFGTVAIRRGDEVLQVTTFRLEHEYADFRRPHRLEFGDDITADLARRDFTVNALAWGRGRGDGTTRPARPVRRARRPRRADPACRRRARRRGSARTRCAWSARCGWRRRSGSPIEAGTLAGVRANAPLVAHLSGERIGAELEKLLEAPMPSIGLRLAEETGLLAVVSPELAAQRGIPQNKTDGEDLWDHTLRTVDAAPAGRPVVRLAALLHDIGKPATLADGHFHHHDAAGADLARELLRRLRYPRAAAEVVEHLIRHHMFTVDPDASDAAIRRFILRIGIDHIDAQFALRRADDIGSGHSPDDHALRAFRARIDAEIAAEAALDRSALRIDGTDLMRELGLAPGPRLGRMIDELVELVIADPALNEPPTLLLLAQGMLADMQDEGSK